MSFCSKLTKVILDNGLKIVMTLWYFTFINYFLICDAAGSAGKTEDIGETEYVPDALC